MYITAADLQVAISERMLIELTNDQPRATEINHEVLACAMRYAQETVDGYLRSRYILPLADVPTLIRHCCVQLARYWLYSRRPESKGFPDNVKDTYKQAVKDLEHIQSGKLHLGIAEHGQPDLLPDESEFTVRAQNRLDLSGY